MNLDGQVALITGGGRGIGKIIALKLAEAGARVVISGTTRSALDATAESIRSSGGDVLAVTSDVSSENDVRSLFNQAREQFGPIDILINNSGIMGPTAAVGDIQLADWERTMAVNLTGAFLCCREVAPQMIERKKGRIINISSMAGRRGYPLRSPYAASKWAMIGLTLTLAGELGPYDVPVNVICPGPIAGDRMRRVIAARAKELGQSVEAVTKQYVGASTLGRMATEEDVADMVAYLVSEHGQNVTGQVIEVAAGYGI